MEIHLEEIDGPYGDDTVDESENERCCRCSVGKEVDGHSWLKTELRSFVEQKGDTSKRPRTRGTMIRNDDHAYCVPAQDRGIRIATTDEAKMTFPVQSMRFNLARIVVSVSYLTCRKRSMRTKAVPPTGRLR